MARVTSSKARSNPKRATPKNAPARKSPAKATSPKKPAAARSTSAKRRTASPTKSARPTKKTAASSAFDPSLKASAPSAPENARPLEGSGTMHACWIITLRVLLGWVMLWAFLDKTFGLGFATPGERAWLAGGSPTTGYLSNVGGTFSGLFQSMAGVALVDWLFMLGLLGVGVAFVFGVKTRMGGIAGSLMMLLMYLAALPLTNNPIVDDHLVYAVAFLAIGFSNYTHKWDAVRNWWLSTDWVKKHPWCA